MTVVFAYHFLCLFVVCVFIGSSASHISLQGWNSLSGTVFPRVLYLKYSFVGFIFFGYVCVCVRNMLLELCSFCPAAFVAFFLEYLLSGLTQREFSWERWAVDQLAIPNFLELVSFFRGFSIEQRNISQCVSEICLQKILCLVRCVHPLIWDFHSPLSKVWI